MEISFHSHLDSNTVIATKFLHGTTAVLSWHVQKFVVIWWPATELQQGEFSIEFELHAKMLVKRSQQKHIHKSGLTLAIGYFFFINTTWNRNKISHTLSYHQYPMESSAQIH